MLEIFNHSVHHSERICLGAESFQGDIGTGVWGSIRICWCVGLKLSKNKGLEVRILPHQWRIKLEEGNMR